MDMIKLNKCCNTDTFTKVKEIYHSNADEFTLYQCSKCEKFWLYRKLETGWMDNIRMKTDEYEEWYIGILEEDLDKVHQLDFDAIGMTHGYLYFSTIDQTQISNWKYIQE
jgi:hypothetical protein